MGRSPVHASARGSWSTQSSVAKKEDNMNAEKISLFSIVVSLLSALFAARSLREAKEARAGNAYYRLLNRKTELLILLSDVLLKATEVRFLAFDCLDIITEKNLPKTDDGARQFNLILDRLNSTESIKKEIEVKKKELNQDSRLKPAELEGLFVQFGGEIRELENQNVVLKRIHKWAKESAGPSVYGAKSMHDQPL